MRVGGVLGCQTKNERQGQAMADSPDVCGTCSLRWYAWNKHPPCLKLTPEERRELGAYDAALGRAVKQDPTPEETTYGDYQDAARHKA